MINIVSHSMYGDEFKEITAKLKDKENWSFVVMDDQDTDKTDFKCYTENDQYVIQQKAVKDYWNTHKYTQKFKEVNIMIVPIIKTTEDADNSVIIRFCRMPLSTDESAFSITSVGFPIMVKITKRCTIGTILKKYFGKESFENKFEFRKCIVNGVEIKENERISALTSDSDRDIPELLVVLEPIESTQFSLFRISC